MQSTRLSANYAEASDNLFVRTVIETAEDAKRKGSWSGKEIGQMYADHPEYDFIRRIFKGDQNAISDLKAIVNSIADVDTLENLNWYPIYTYNVESRKAGRKAINAYKKVVNARIQQLMEANVNGTNVEMETRAYTLDEIEALFVSLNENSDIAKLAKKVFATAKRLGLVIHGVRSIESTSNIAGGQLFEQIAYRAPYFNDKAISNQEKARVILHELIHGCTVYAIRAYEKHYDLSSSVEGAVRTLNRIFNEVSQDDLFKGEYGAKNVYEMVAELADPKFREKLVQRNLWERIIDAIKRLFGIGSTTYLDGVAISLDILLDNIDQAQYERYIGRDSQANRTQNKMLFAESPSDSAVMQARNVDTSIANFDISLYNEIKISSQEMRELQSEALTWDADKRNVPLRRSLSNGYEYLYVIDDNSTIHVYDRKKSKNIHDLEKNYGNKSAEQFDQVAEELRSEQGNNNRNRNVSGYRYEHRPFDSGNNRSLRQSGNGDGGRYSQASSYDRRQKKAKGYKFDDDGRVIQITYSDGTVENITPSDSSVYSFRGENSSAENVGLDIAKQMEADGKSSEAIRKATGWFRSYDNRWRYEIDDSKAVWHIDTAKPDSTKLFRFGERVYKLGDLLDHPELYEAYPQLKNATVWENPYTEFGGYVPGRSTDSIAIKDIDDNTTTKWTILHEVQHLIQNIEGFARGASKYEYTNLEWGNAEYEALEKRKEVARKLYAVLRRNGVSISRDAIDIEQYSTSISDEIIENNYWKLRSLANSNKRTEALVDEYYNLVQFLNGTTPEGQYYRTAGEIEAYDTQFRMDKSDEERRAMRPDIDRNNAIVRYQPRETREYTDRELLAGALDSVATSEEDRKKLTQYKKKAAEADELDRTLSELRAKKKALEEAKAKRSEIRAVQDEITKTQNRITIWNDIL